MSRFDYETEGGTHSRYPANIRGGAAVCEGALSGALWMASQLAEEYERSSVALALGAAASIFLIDGIRNSWVAIRDARTDGRNLMIEEQREANNIALPENELSQTLWLGHAHANSKMDNRGNL